MRVMLYKDYVDHFVNGDGQIVVKVIVGTHTNENCIGLCYRKNGRFYSYNGISDDFISNLEDVNILELIPINNKVELLIFEGYITKSELLNHIWNDNPLGYEVENDIITINYN